MEANRSAGGIGPEIDLDDLERNLMTQRNHLMRTFRRHDSRDTRRRQRFALLEFAADDCLQSRRRHLDLAARDRLAPRDRLFADIDHPDLSAVIKMRQVRGDGNEPPLWGLFLARHRRSG